MGAGVCVCPCKHHGRQGNKPRRDENENLAQPDLVSLDQTSRV